MNLYQRLKSFERFKHIKKIDKTRFHFKSKCCVSIFRFLVIYFSFSPPRVLLAYYCSVKPIEWGVNVGVRMLKSVPRILLEHKLILQTNNLPISLLGVSEQTQIYKMCTK